MSSISLTEKYRAKSFISIKGQEFAIEKLSYFAKNFPNYKKALILYGPPGTGKTTLAYALAKEINAEVVEINSSDLRDRDNIDRIIKPATEQMSLFKETKVILIDEVDGISAKDRGGLDTLLGIIEETAFPIILTANDIWDKKFAELRKVSEIVPVKQLNYRAIFYLLKEISEKEKLTVDEESLLRISIKSNGDVRAAINDLEVVKDENKEDDILSKNVLNRDEKKDIFNIVKEILKDKFSDDTLRLFDKTDLSLDEIFLWLEENICLEYKDEELYKAYDALSIADLFRGRIIRRQHWRFLVYQSLLLSAGVSSAKNKPKLGFTTYKKPSRILKTWILNQKNAKKKSIVKKYADSCHISYAKAIKDFPIMVHIFKNPDIQKQLEINEQEAEYINGYGK